MKLRRSSMFAALSLAVVVQATLMPLAVPAGAASRSFDTERIRQLVRNRLVLPRFAYSGGVRGWLNAPEPGDQELPRALTPSIGTNVDANDPSRDLGGGQSETAIAASGDRVVVAWNDASGFLAPPGSTLPSLSGVSISSDGGKSFHDLIGLPNVEQNQSWSGDPMVASIDHDHFVVGGLYFPSNVASCKDGPIRATMALTVGTVTNGGSSMSFADPVQPVESGNLCGRRPPRSAGLLDKEFVAYDPVSRTIAISYTRYFFFGKHSGLGQIEVVIATVPSDPTQLSADDFRRVRVWEEEGFCNFPDELPSEATQCNAQNAGAYPAVAPNGDVYVAWERNIDTLLFFGDPFAYEHAAVVPAGTSAPSAGGRGDPVVITLGQANSNASGGVHSLNAQAIAGFNRGLGNDFPRIAFDPAGDRVVFVWNDASLHPLGDIWLRTSAPGLLALSPIRKINDDVSFALHFMPAVSVGTDGSIRTSWYDRRTAGGDSAETDYVGEIRPSEGVDTTDFVVSTGSTDWIGASSLIVPNFGDYTDNFTTGTTTYYVWSDGRLGVPQPMVDSHP